MNEPVLGLKGAWGLFLNESAGYLFVIALISLPGFIFFRRWLDRKNFSPLESFTMGMICGLFSGSILSSIFIAFLGYKIRSLIFGFLFLSLLVRLLPLKKILAKTIEERQEEKFDLYDLIFLFICLVLLTFFSLIPLSRICEETQNGYAVRAYFIADYMKHISVTAELAKGDFPPENPYFKGEKLHYYWLAYIPSAITYRLLGKEASLIRITIAFSLLANILLVLSIFALFFRYISNRFARYASIFSLFFASSYEGIVLLIRIYLKNATLLTIKKYNIDALTRWDFGHPQIDSLFRSFLYTPQQQLSLSALCMLLILIYPSNWIFCDHRWKRLFHLSLIGILAGAVVGYNFFTGAVVLPWILICITIGAFKNWRRSPELLLPLIIISIIMGFYFLCQMFLQSRGILYLVREVKFYRHLPLILFYNFGPLLALGLAGILIWLIKSDNRWNWLFPVLLLIQSLGWIIFIRIKDFPSDVALKTGLIAAILLALSAGYFIEFLFSKSKIAGLALLAALIIPAFFTLPIDLYNSQDITNSQFTTYFKKWDIKAARWLCHNTPYNIVIQAMPDRDVNCCDIITTFAERRTFLADNMHSQIYLIEPENYKQRLKEVIELFTSEDLNKVIDRCKSRGLDGVFIGKFERQFLHSGLNKFQILPLWYRDLPVEIFKVDCKFENDPFLSLSPGLFYLQDLYFQNKKQIFIDIGEPVSTSWVNGSFSIAEEEKTPEGSFSYQWLTDDKCSVRIPPLSDEEVILKFRVAPLIAPNFGEQILHWSIIGINESNGTMLQEITTSGSIELEPRWKEYEVIIPPKSKGEMRMIIFSPQKMGIPAKLLQNSNDQRTLSVAFDWIFFHSPKIEDTLIEKPTYDLSNDILPAPSFDKGLIISQPGMLKFCLQPLGKMKFSTKVLFEAGEDQEAHFSAFIGYYQGNCLQVKLINQIKIQSSQDKENGTNWEFDLPNENQQFLFILATSRIPDEGKIELKRAAFIVE